MNQLAKTRAVVSTVCFVLVLACGLSLAPTLIEQDANLALCFLTVIVAVVGAVAAFLWTLKE